MKFSIGIPAYKSKFLSDCILSVINQTYSDFELIIVNDNSPEPVEEIVSGFDDARIRYYKNSSNFGAENVVYNWNRCLELSRGEFFILLGDDDLLSPDYLMSFNDVIDKNNLYNVFHCQTVVIDTLGNVLFKTPFLKPVETLQDLITERLIFNRSQYISDFVYRTRELKNEGGFYYTPLAQMADDITAYRSCGSTGVCNVQKYVFMYRQHNTTISATGNEKLILKGLGMGEEWVLQEIGSNKYLNQKHLSGYLFKIKILISFHKKKLEVLNRLIINNGFTKNTISDLKKLKKSNLISTKLIIHLIYWRLKRFLLK